MAGFLAFATIFVGGKTPMRSSRAAAPDLDGCLGGG